MATIKGAYKDLFRWKLLGTLLFYAMLLIAGTIMDKLLAKGYANDITWLLDADGIVQIELPTEYMKEASK